MRWGENEDDWEGDNEMKRDRFAIRNAETEGIRHRRVVEICYVGGTKYTKTSQKIYN